MCLKVGRQLILIYKCRDREGFQSWTSIPNLIDQNQTNFQPQIQVFHLFFVMHRFFTSWTITSSYHMSIVLCIWKCFCFFNISHIINYFPCQNKWAIQSYPIPEQSLVVIKFPYVGINAVIMPNRAFTNKADSKARRRPTLSLRLPQIMAPIIIPMNVIAAENKQDTFMRLGIQCSFLYS